MTTTTITTIRTAAAALAFTALLGACANNPPTSAGAGSTEAAPAAPVTTAGVSGSTTPDDVGALLSTSSAGDILVGTDGRALYGFTNDSEALSTCYGTCADAWPPVIVGPEWTVGPGLDTGIFATTEREDGQLQLVAGRWPLYYYTGDAVSGDINGQGSGDVWFLIDPGGRLITDGPTGASEPDNGAATDEYSSGPPGASDGEATGDEESAGAGTSGLVGKAATDLGTVLTDGDGLTLYGFTADEDREPSCYDACAQAWPPVLVDGSDLPDGLDPELYTVVERTDGTWQLAAGDWPLYRFGGDGAKGDLNGQGSGGKWFAAAPDGTLVRS